MKVKIPSGWLYVRIDLEIDDVVVDSRIASHITFDRLYNELLRQGQTQRLPWAIFISRWKYGKHNPQIDNSWQPRDRKGRFIKINEL